MKKRKDPKVLGRTDVALYLGVSSQYVDKMVSEGKIPSQETSSGMIFFERDILAFKRNRMKKAKSDARIRLKKTK